LGVLTHPSGQENLPQIVSLIYLKLYNGRLEVRFAGLAEGVGKISADKSIFATANAFIKQKHKGGRRKSVR
jgi:hypothetical protein